MKSRRKIYFVRQGIQGGFALSVIFVLLTCGVLLAWFLYRDLKLNLTTCLTFAHIKCDRPIELVKETVARYSLYGLGVALFLSAGVGYYFISRVRKGLSVLEEEMREFLEKGEVTLRPGRYPVEIEILREKFHRFVSSHSDKMREVRDLARQAREIIEDEGVSSGRSQGALEKLVEAITREGRM
ncbi:MAG: hypothetical protein D6713_07600 [Deltaproteobacteria bacterium]|nr:MAG: hypothetical protein D6713_07600 [Deltaproteobacteria bacterium]